MRNDEILLQIETVTANCANQGERFVWFVWCGHLEWDTCNPVPYAAANFICRIHIDAARHGLTWRIREKIAWRLDVLRQRSIIT